MTDWAHLPNAGLIDAALEDVETRPEAWAAGWGTVSARIGDRVWGGEWLAARGRAFAFAKSEGRSSAYDAVHVLTWGREPNTTADGAQLALQDTALALIAWDASADMLRLTPDALRTIIDTCDGDVKHQAVLLLPAVIARNTL